MAEWCTRSKVAIWAYCLMPNHLHLLAKSGNQSLSQSMRRLLIGYVINFNRRHKRYGHLFQNRYKSIICEEDPYLLELARYIHLNPVRAGMVKGLRELRDYPWTGHGVIIGRQKREWQDVDAVLAYFGQRREKAVSDERILGSGKFIERVFSEAEERVRETLGWRGRVPDFPVLLKEISKRGGVEGEKVLGGDQRRSVVKVRKIFCREAVKKFGYSGARVARFLGVTTSLVNRDHLQIR
ncbi:MAG: transposase [Deltaproteobacteria bacterium]|nr:transposase [Deltaproteobacteria bacterium]